MRRTIIAILASLLIAGTTNAYVIQPGDTLSKLAKRFNTTVNDLTTANNIQNPNLIYAGESLDLDDSLIGINVLPADSYDTYITSPMSTSVTTTYVNSLPGVSSSVYTIFASDGVTVSEKIYCTGFTTSPKALTGCVRGISVNPVNGTIRETAGTGITHSKNSRIAITDNINFTGKALAILNGAQETGADTFFIGTTNTAGIKIEANDRRFIAFNNGTNPWYRYNTSTSHWQFSDDGINTTNFASSSANGLSASSSAGIGITDSFIHILPSSSLGMTFGPDGRLYQKVSSTRDLAQDTDGIYVVTSSLVTKIATSTPTPGKLPIANSAGNLNDWVPIATTSLPFTVGTILDNTWYTYPLVFHPNVAPAGAADHTNAFMNFFASVGTADVVRKYGGFTSTTLLASAQTYVTGLMPTSSGNGMLKFGDNRTTTMEWRMRVPGMNEGYETFIGVVSSTEGTADLIAKTASTTAAGTRIGFDFSYLGVSANPHLATITSNDTATTRNIISGFDWRNWHTYRIEWSKNAVNFYIDGVLQFTHTTNIPTMSAAASGVGFAFGQTGNMKTSFQITDPIISQQL